jgi:1-deoxy-D-xylulose-5-phosphate reductoisomerase
VDSEHSAIWQCLWGEERSAVARVVLTASGGAFRDYTPEQLARVTPEEALRHPTWQMGRKITIDSATLINKGFEAIETRWLFDVPLERIEVVLHRESIIHSLVEFADGSVKAQLGEPDMRLPIRTALCYPERLPSSTVSPIDLARIGALHFAAPDFRRFPALALATSALGTPRRGISPAKTKPRKNTSSARGVQRARDWKVNTTAGPGKAMALGISGGDSRSESSRSANIA